jgi:hypothetical protein
MNWTKVKNPADVQLPGLDVQIERVDGNVHAITFSAGGKSVRCAYSGYSIDLQVPSPPKLETKFRVVGTVGDLDVNKVFDDETEAHNYIDRWTERTPGTVALAPPEKVEIPVEV